VGKKFPIGYEEYYESGVWKCDKSPTGAHHWIELTSSNKVKGMWCCKYCSDVTKFPLTWEEYTRQYGAFPLTPSERVMYIWK